MSDDEEDGVEYSVVVNNVRNNIRSGPSAETKGWRKAGREGKKKDCLVYIGGGLDGYAPVERQAQARRRRKQKDWVKLPAKTHQVLLTTTSSPTVEPAGHDTMKDGMHGACFAQ
jgi:uncharacterized protein YbdZ (MbtH family)